MFRFSDIGMILSQVEGGGAANLNIQNIGEPAPNPKDVELLNEGDDNVEDPENQEEAPESGRRERNQSTNQETTEDTGDEPEPQEDEEEERESRQEEDVDEEIDLTEDEEEQEPEPDTTEKNIWQKLKGVDKDILKKVPELRTIVGQHQQFTQVFATPQDAVQAMEIVDTFNDVESQLLDGNIKDLFGSLHKNAPTALPKIARNLLKQLWEVDKDAHAAAVRPVLVDIVNRFKEDGALHNNQNIIRSSKWLSQYLFGSPEPPKPEVGPTPQEKQLQEQLEQERNTHFQANLQRVSQIAKSRLENEILKIVDSKMKLPERIRKNIIEDVYNTISEEIKKDTAYMHRMGRLQSSAYRSKFSRGEDASIISAFLARTKNLVPTTARRIMEEWNVGNDNDTGNSRGSRGNSGDTGNRGQNNNSRTQNKPQNQGNTRPRVTPGGNAEVSKDTREVKYDPSDIDWNKTDNRMLLDGAYYRKKDGKKVRFRRQY